MCCCYHARQKGIYSMVICRTKYNYWDEERRRGRENLNLKTPCFSHTGFPSLHHGNFTPPNLLLTCLERTVLTVCIWKKKTGIKESRLEFIKAVCTHI